MKRAAHREPSRSESIAPKLTPDGIPKAPTGIVGLDEVTLGGLPQGRPTLICGPAGSGKTLFGAEFLFRGIVQYHEPGVFVAFEESASDIVANVGSLGFDFAKAEADGQLVIDHVSVVRGEIEQGKDWDLDGLFLRLGAAIDTVGAKRIVIDTIEILFGVFADTGILRSELHRLFGWLKEREVTAVVTAERGNGALTRYGIEEYVSDCVIVLDNRMIEESSTRTLRIVKYRGSAHGTNEYPFLISESGVSILPVTSSAARPTVSSERVSSGVDGIDDLLDGQGFFRKSTILVNAPPGAGKSTLAAQFCDAACRRGERAIYFAREESEAELFRNMASVGLDLRHWVDAGLLRLECVRPRVLGLEAHLFDLRKVVRDFEPDIVVIDPISDLFQAGTPGLVAITQLREIDYLKRRGVTVLLTCSPISDMSSAEQQVATVADARLVVAIVQQNGAFLRTICVLKARGIASSDEIREYRITNVGIRFVTNGVNAGHVAAEGGRAPQGDVIASTKPTFPADGSPA